MRKPFHFKHFFLYDDQSTMKIGTDAVLLGTWTEAPNAARILDAGTGCGIIALMIAQKSRGDILAIDIDEGSVMQATSNFLNSPWPDKLTARRMSLQELAAGQSAAFDLIVSNPPYFRKSLKPDCRKRTLARHDDMLTPEDLLKSVSVLLTQSGLFNVVLPALQEREFSILAKIHGLRVHQKLSFVPVTGKAPNRLLLSLSKQPSPCISSTTLTMRNADGSHSEEFIQFTRDYYLFDPETIRKRINES